MAIVTVGLLLRPAPPVSGTRIVPLRAQMSPWQESVALTQLVRRHSER